MLRVTSNGSKTYDTSDKYKIDAYISDTTDKYQGGGQLNEPSTIVVAGGKITWTARDQATITVVMKNV